MTRLGSKCSIFGLGALLMTSCAHVRTSNDTPVVVLDGYSQENYTVLDRHLEAEVCVKGKLHSDTAGIYFPLQPIEDENLISVGFSRISTDIATDLGGAGDLSSRSDQTVCGFLVESTPFARCKTNYCRWFELRSSVFQSRR